MQYGVVGHARSGTSMLMQCMIAGGLKPVYDKAKEALLQQAAPHANPRGFYEMHTDSETWQHPGWNLKDCDGNWVGDGRVRKFDIFSAYLAHPYRYKMVFIQRPYSEVFPSMQKVREKLGEPMPWYMAKERDYDTVIQHMQRMLLNRKDMDIYCNVVNSPDLLMYKLVQKRGWEIDPEAAAAAVDPLLYRERA